MKPKDYSPNKEFRKLKKGERRRKTDWMAACYIEGKGWSWFHKFDPTTHHEIQGAKDTWPTYRLKRKTK